MNLVTEILKPRLIPRVTEILKAVGLGYRDDDTGWQSRREEGMQRGKALHKAIEWYDAGKPMLPLHEEIEGGFNAYLKFRQDHDHVIWATEYEGVHPNGWQGHIDRVGLLDGVASIIDWKYSKKPNLRFANFQTAAYQILWEASEFSMTLPRDDALRHVEKRYVVALHPDGTYDIHPMSDEGDPMTVFTAAVLVYKAQER